MFAALVLALLGVHSYLIAPAEHFSAMSFSRIDVVADAGDLPPERVRVAVTRPLEAALQTLPVGDARARDVDPGSAELIVEFDPKTDPRVDLQYVDRRSAQVRGDIPAAKNIVAVIVNPNGEPVVSYALTSPCSRKPCCAQFVDVADRAGVRRHARARPHRRHGRRRRRSTTSTSTRRALAAPGSARPTSRRRSPTRTTCSRSARRERIYQRYVLLVDASLRDARSLGAIGDAAQERRLDPGRRRSARVRLGVGARDASRRRSTASTP